MFLGTVAYLYRRDLVRKVKTDLEVMSAKKKQEEKHLQSLKALQQLDFNKRCFECDQRGPTYVDVTIGSFVCTSCGGVLRGLNPPHRVKSVSMATFTPAEISLMESRGNEFCRNIYLGKYDSKSKPRPDSKDHAKLKFFMEQKYEQKRWYVSPEQAQKPTAVVKQPETNATKVESAKPLTTLLGNNAPKLRLDKPVNQPTPINNYLADFSSVQPTTTVASTSQTSGDGFADFSSAFSTQSFDAFGDFTSGTGTASNASITTSDFANFSTPLNPIGSTTTPSQPAADNSKSVDKYADLGDLFSESTNSSSAGVWSSGTSTVSGNNSVFGSSGQSQTSVFGSSGQSQTSVFGSSNQQQTSVFGSNPSVFGTSPQQPLSVFGPQQPANMFGKTTQLGSSPFSYSQPSSISQQQGTFAYNQQGTAAQVASTASAFGFTQQPVNTGAPFSSVQFSTAPAAFGNQTGGFMSKAQQPFMSTASATMVNPFMQASQPSATVPASNTSNPFMMQQSSQLAQPNRSNPFMSTSNPTPANTANPFF